MKKYVLFFLITPLIILSQQWKLIGLEEERVNAIAVDPNNNSIIYAGSMSSFSDGIYGKLFKSIDDGVTWDTLLYNLSVQEISIHPQKTNNIYVALASTNFTRPGILKSTNSGESWSWADSGVTLNYEISVATVVPHPDSLDVAYAGTVGFYGGSVYKTIDGGRFWKQYPANVMCCQFEDIFFDPVDHSTIYVGSGRLYRSTDSGSKWNVLNDWTPVSGGVKLAIDYKNNNILYAGLPGYRLLKSSDCGENWYFADSGIVDYRFQDLDISKNDSKTLFTITGDGVLVTRDGANSWNVLSSALPTDLIKRKIALTQDDRFLYCGTDKGLYKLDLLTSVEETNSNYYDSIKLFQNYPNPFNPSTQISYQIPKDGFVNLVVYNALGQEVAQLVNQNQSIGKYNVKFDANNLPSGVYIYKLQAGEFSSIKKMILTK